MARTPKQIDHWIASVRGRLTSLEATDEIPWFDANFGDGHGSSQGDAGTDGLLRAVHAQRRGEPQSGVLPATWLHFADGGVRLWGLREEPEEGFVSGQGEAAPSLEVVVDEGSDDPHSRTMMERYDASLLIRFASSDAFVVGQWACASRERARERAHEARGRLEAWLARRMGGPEAAESETAEGASCAGPFSRASRLVLRREGNLMVLRDHGSLGPREPALRETVATLLTVGVTGVVAWFAHAAWESQQTRALGVLVVVGIVLALTAFALSQIATHSWRFVANNEALAYFARDRFVLRPWMDRQGRVDESPQGRFGAALPYSEWLGFEVRKRAALYRLTLLTDHGPYEVAAFGAESVAWAWARVLTQTAGDLFGRTLKSETLPSGENADD